MLPYRSLALAGVLVLSVSACAPALNVSTAPAPAESTAKIDLSVTETSNVPVGQPVMVTAQGGRLTDVKVSGPKGELKGTLSPDGATWEMANTSLAYGATYTVNAAAVDSRGLPTTTTTSFTTLEPEKFFSARAYNPGYEWATVNTESAKLGVGMPIIVEFNKPVKNKAEVEQALVVKTPTSIEGAWAWINNKTVEFRPREYWPGNIDVTVDMNLKGVEASPGIFGEKDTSKTFQYGDAMVSIADANTHQIKVFKNGKKIGSIPFTSGKPGWETRSGIKVFTTKERTRIMDAASNGEARNSPDYYRLEVEYALRMTNTGEFVHAAPWSTYAQGSSDVSHGCIGISTENAAWFWNKSKIGDVIVVKNTGREQNIGNGITLWNIPWNKWLKDSATGAIMTTATTSTTPLVPETTTPDAILPSMTPTPVAPSPSASVAAAN